ncbi:hypothetical protein FACS189429_2980 [Bacteroidia bacterium]|nr:hypothetical protein FACS189429_2980 [Bacteroidia bacterium]
MKKYFLLTTVFTAIFVFLSCQKDDFDTNPNLKLQFSTDTVSFDTVFTTIGTTTKIFKVYNRNTKPLKINSIYLENGANSFFKINVDGVAAANQQFTDVEILAHDSIFIFVTAKIDPTNQNNPLLIDEKVVFSLNNNKQNVVLEAIGQDVELLRNFVIYNDTVWNADKPFLIYDTLFVAENATLTIPAGAKMYFHQSAAIVAAGSVQAIGTRENPILMRGDRLDNVDALLPYNFVSGQWGGVFLLGKGTDNVFKNVFMNSSEVGIFLYNENIDTAQMPDLQIENCKFTNFTFYGLFVFNGNVTALNSEISNSGTYTLFLNGGTHTFVHTTIANYYGASQPAQREKETVAVLINDTKKITVGGQEMTLSHSITSFYNSIIMGSMETEFALITENPEMYIGRFENNFIRKKEVADFSNFLNNSWFREGDFVFANTDLKWEKDKKMYYDFRLDSLSPARDIADIQFVNQFNLQFDLNGNLRTADNKPDAGAYEWQTQ